MARPRAAPPAVHPDVRRHWRPLERPHYRELRDRHYRHRWYCGPGCRLTFIFAFTLWPRPLAVYEHTDGYWPLFEALEYNATGEPSLWESDWGYVEFTSIATYRSSYPVRIAGRFEERWRWCRDFRRVVVRGDGLVRRYGGTACRHETRRFWRITRSYRIG